MIPLKVAIKKSVESLYKGGRKICVASMASANNTMLAQAIGLKELPQRRSLVIPIIPSDMPKPPYSIDFAKMLDAARNSLV
jgi:hypothetical protein